MIKIELEDVVKNYSDFIWRTIERWMSSRPDDEKEIVMEEILRVYENGKEIRGENGEKSKKAFIRRVTTCRCIDHWRYIESGTYGPLNPLDDPYLRKQKGLRNAAKRQKKKSKNGKREKALLIHMCQAVETFGLDGLKHLDLFEDYAFGLTRKKAAAKYRLNEQQVKGRMERAKMRILQELKRVRKSRNK
jgi:hypothetical protein